MATALPSPAEKRKLPSGNFNDNQPKKGHWSAGLSIAMEDESVRLYKDDLCTIIKDKFPKVCSYLSFLGKISIFYSGSYSFTCYAE